MSDTIEPMPTNGANRQRQGLQDRLEIDGLDPAAATTVRLTVDGWWLAALL